MRRLRPLGQVAWDVMWSQVARRLHKRRAAARVRSIEDLLSASLGPNTKFIVALDTSSLEADF